MRAIQPDLPVEGSEILCEIQGHEKSTWSVSYNARVNSHPDSATLEAYREVMFRQSSTVRAFGNSFGLALGAAVLLMAVAIPLGYFLTWRSSPSLKLLNVVVELPYRRNQLVCPLSTTYYC